MPSADTCVPCLEAQGDVDLIKRHDDYTGKDGENVEEIYFTRPNQYLQQHLDKLRGGIGTLNMTTYLEAA